MTMEAAMFSRNVTVLTLCQFLSVSSSVLIVTLGGIIGAALTPDPVLATLPLSVMVVGTAAATVFAAMLMARVGRRRGFIAGACIAMVGAGIACLGLLHGQFGWFCAGIALVGVNTAFVQQYRFAAAESVLPGRAATAISLVLAGSIGGALFAPLLTNIGASHDHATSDAITYLPAIAAVIALQFVNALVLACLREQPALVQAEHVAAARPLRKIVGQPRYMIAVLGGVVGYGTMTLVMTATPLSMHLTHGFSVEDTAGVIRSHVLAMYLPSLVSGTLIAWIGAPRLMFAGVVCIAGTVAVGLQGHALHHYAWSLVLLGVGWNFLYVGGTALLLQTYRENEKYTAQAVNEFSVFGSSALASLLAGSVIHWFGWNTLLLTTAPALLLMVIGLAWLFQTGRERVPAH